MTTEALEHNVEGYGEFQFFDQKPTKEFNGFYVNLNNPERTRIHGTRLDNREVMKKIRSGRLDKVTTIIKIGESLIQDKE